MGFRQIAHYFNPHSHKGSDRFQFGFIVQTTISIHTPTRGVTQFDFDFGGLYDISIHTPTRGVTNAK